MGKATFFWRVPVWARLFLIEHNTFERLVSSVGDDPRSFGYTRVERARELVIGEIGQKLQGT